MAISYDSQTPATSAVLEGQVLVINIEELPGSKKTSALIVVDDEQGSEDIARGLTDNGQFSIEDAVTVSSIETVDVSMDYLATIVMVINGTILTITATVKDQAAIDPSKGGRIEEDTIFYVDSVVAVDIDKRSSSLANKIYVNTEEEEVRIGTKDILTSSNLEMLNNGINRAAGTKASMESPELSLHESASKAITATTMPFMSGETKMNSILSAMITTDVNTSTAEDVFYRNIRGLRGFDEMLLNLDKNFTYGELEKIFGTLPAVTTGTEIVDTDMTKELASISSELVKALKIFAKVGIAFDNTSGTCKPVTEVKYAPGVKTSTHQGLINATMISLQSLLTRYIITCYNGIPNGKGNVVLQKDMDNSLIFIYVTTEEEQSRYIIRDNSTEYSTITGDSQTLVNSAKLINNTLDNL